MSQPITKKQLELRVLRLSGYKPRDLRNPVIKRAVADAMKLAQRERIIK